LHIKPASSEIKIDGDVSEQAWNDAELVTNFFMVQPMDTSFAKIKTDIKMTYDKENLYIIAICYHEPGPYFVESLRRDFAFGKNDNFLMFMDPFNDLTNGFSFGTSDVSIIVTYANIIAVMLTMPYVNIGAPFILYNILSAIPFVGIYTI
jgi:hypothetical protein